ncbi:DUF4937 domain-containing protein [Kitasatospora sp. HPMI-4]|uniref:DUF4937 domain-containing protein n=1 Tax=Kitasatospora sp. HPMI-4 TaxID=3448443 RepID=UPI003F1A6366
MWGKWIVCGVPTAARAEFSSGQRAWSAISDQPGLVGQLGGWDLATGRAHVLALWADVDSYRGFMRERHDAVAATARQSAAYDSIGIATGETVLEWAGDLAGLPDAVEAAGLLRLADCRLLPGRAEHFLSVQRRLWVPGMAAAGGMLAGAAVRLGQGRCLIATLWSGQAAHRRYVARHLPELRARAALADDLRSMTGHVVALEPAWRARPEPVTP